MKKILYLLAIGFASAVFTGCDETLLDTAPTDKVSSEVIFSSAEGAQVAINGIYRAMHIPGWSSSWSAENPGQFAITLVKDLQGEDHLMAAQGNGWFYYDYAFNVDADYTGTSGRQYAQWNFNYTIISQTNYVIDNEDRLVELGSKGIDVVAQAYTLRAMAYTSLYEWFCQGNYAKNSSAPGVPIYTEPTNSETKGKPRGTVAEVFTQINADFAKAVELFKDANTTQTHKSHIDIYVAYLLWARAAQIQENWPKAAEYANAALAKPGLARVASISELGQFNDRNTADVLWAFEVITDQSGPYSYYYTHMDPEGGYGSRAPQCIDAWLWNQIPETDARKHAWWDDGSRYTPYTQTKIRFSDLVTNIGDEFFLRAEEALLIAAEAAVRQSDWTTARNLLTELGAKRDTDYASRLASRTNSAAYNSDTHGAFTTLMDEVLFQRRIELWSEGLGRAFDLRRLSLGYTRNYEGTNHPSKRVLTPDDPRFVTLLPQKEFDSNEELTVADQNPR
jgi:hypothetical protein